MPFYNLVTNLTNDLYLFPLLQQVSLCQGCIDWARSENRVFLRQALESRLIALYVDTKQYPASLAMASSLLKELKKIDDKALLVEVNCMQGDVHLMYVYLECRDFSVAPVDMKKFLTTLVDKLSDMGQLATTHAG